MVKIFLVKDYNAKVKKKNLILNKIPTLIEPALNSYREHRNQDLILYLDILELTDYKPNFDYSKFMKKALNTKKPKLIVITNYTLSKESKKNREALIELNALLKDNGYIGELKLLENPRNINFEVGFFYLEAYKKELDKLDCFQPEIKYIEDDKKNVSKIKYELLEYAKQKYEATSKSYRLKKAINEQDYLKKSILMLEVINDYSKEELLNLQTNFFNAILKDLTLEKEVFKLNEAIDVIIDFKIKNNFYTFRNLIKADYDFHNKDDKYKEKALSLAETSIFLEDKTTLALYKLLKGEKEKVKSEHPIDYDYLESLIVFFNSFLKLSTLTPEKAW